MKLIATIGVLILIAGCATTSQQQAVNPYAEYISYVDATRHLVDSGQIKRSDYYLGLYEVASRLNNVPDRGELMATANKAISIAKQLESGEITLDEFESKRRSINADTAARIDAREAEHQLRMQEIQASKLAPEPYIYRPYIRKSRPLPAPQLRLPQQTNCTTYGNQTNCTTY